MTAALSTGPGSTVLQPNEVVTAFRLPAPPARTGSVYQRHTPRKIMDIAVVGVGIRLSLDGKGAIADARICLGAVAPTVIRAPRAEAALEGRAPEAATLEAAVRVALEEVHPISDVRASDWYRRELIHNMLKRVLIHVCKL